jgi:exopolysaccharide biosynthesis polyprenyl glycosylphosphotransferase
MTSTTTNDILVTHVPSSSWNQVEFLELSPQAGFQAAAKRVLDFAGSLTALILLVPLLLMIAVAVAIESGWPVLFVQKRLGYRGREFRVFKFRSMRRDAEARFEDIRQQNEVTDGPIFKARQDPRITRVGRILRKTSMDELPQLLNVLLGHMSLVGPRPPLESEVLQYEAWQLRRLAVKPGMTGLWQVSGRSDLGFQDMVRLDISYVEDWSIWTDLKLLVRTPLAVITGRGAY